MLESVRFCALTCCYGLEAKVLLFTFFELFVELDLVLDRVKPSCFALDLAHLGQRLIEQLVDLCEHLGAVCWPEDPGRADQGRREGQEPGYLELVLVLPSICLSAAQLEKHL